MTSLKEQFVSFETAMKLKELGFNEPCFAAYRLSFEEECEPFEKTELFFLRELYDNNNHRLDFGVHRTKGGICTAPLHQQAAQWLNENSYDDLKFIIETELEKK